VTLPEAIVQFFDSAAGQAALAVLAVGIVDFALEMLAAYRDGVFRLDNVAAWIRSDLAGRILPIWLLLFIGHYATGIQFANIPLILAAGLGAAGLYVAETLAAILREWGPASMRRAKPTESEE
jgi:hypothetical protein